MIIVESRDSLSNLLIRLHTSPLIVIPIYKDVNLHYSINELLLIYVYIIKDKKGYILPINTDDCLNISHEDLSEFYKHLSDGSTPKYVINKSHIINLIPNLDDKYFDVRVIEYICKNRVDTQYDDYTIAHRFIYHLHYTLTNLNTLIPVAKHYEYLDNIKNKILNLLDTCPGINFEEAFKKLNNIMLPTLTSIEQNGIYVKPGFSREDIVHDEYIHTEYNIFTTTNRPTCNFRGYSFSSIPKDSMDKKHMVSRFGKNGQMILLDYNSYHLYLISNIIGEAFTENIHSHLGKIYFGKDVLTEEEYNSSKTITFKMIYGGIDHEFLQIPFFEKIQQFTDELWKAYSADRGIYTKYFKRKFNADQLESMNSQKLFNYYLQSLETENTILRLHQLQDFMTNLKSKVILYIYDAVLLDYNLSDGKENLNQIISILDLNGKYPMSIYYGDNYADMTKIT